MGGFFTSIRDPCRAGVLISSFAELFSNRTAGRQIILKARRFSRCRHRCA
jgi:hypothetical protein